jgi:hypothetical protein
MNDDTSLPAVADKTPLANSIPQESNPMSVANMWASMVEMVKDPTIDAQKIGHLVEIQEKMIDRAASDRFKRAFAQACQKMPIITKDDKIEHNGKFIGWFKKYEDLREIVDSIINPLGLTVTHDSDQIDGGKGGLTIWTVITYMDSEYTWQEERGRMPLPPDAGGAKSAAQGIGSSATYGQRYSLTAAFGIVQKGLDRDGKSQAAAQLASPDQNQHLIDAGQRAAMGGPKAYAGWLNDLTNIQKGWMVTHGHHDKLTQTARDIAAQQQGQDT